MSTIERGSRWRGRALLAAGLTVGWLVLGPAAAIAQIDVFHSPTLDGNPGPDDPFKLPSGTGLALDLWIKKGDTASGGNECSSGAGDELCGYDVTLQVSGNASFVSFTRADPSKQQYNASNGRVRIVGVNALSPPTGEQHLGTLVIDNPAPGIGKVEVKAASATSQENQAVGASLQMEVIDQQVVAVPEPTGPAGLVCGIAVLAGLSARRARRAR